MLSESESEKIDTEVKISLCAGQQYSICFSCQTESSRLELIQIQQKNFSGMQNKSKFKTFVQIISRIYWRANNLVKV